MTDEQIIQWAYEHFGLDCCPTIAERDDGEYLTLINRQRGKQYSVPMALLRQNILGNVSAVLLQ